MSYRPNSLSFWKNNYLFNYFIVNENEYILMLTEDLTYFEEQAQG